MSVEMVDFCPDYDVAKDRQDLICIQDPFLLLEGIHIVKFLDLSVHHLGTMIDGLHFADRSLGGLELVESHLALLVWLLTDDELIETTLGASYAGLYGLFVEAKLLLDEEGGRRFFLEQFEDLEELTFAFFIEAKRAVPDNIIEELILEENSHANAQQVVLIGNERVVVDFSLGKCVQIVIVDQGFLQYFDHLVDAVYEFADLADSVGIVRKIADDVINELLFDLR